jgi:tRNA(His) guanylyltransferase
MSKDTKDLFGNRMKAYEACSSIHLIPGTPKIIRLDGKAFHTFTKGCEQPYDWNIMNSMAQGAMAVMKEIGGSARLAYIQSDECSIVLNDKPKIESSPWFDNNLVKMASVSAAIMAVNFSWAYYESLASQGCMTKGSVYFKPAYFDARIFQIPHIDEMVNAVLWRQFDARKNSVSQYARHYFSQKQVHGKNGKDKIEMMKAQNNFDWHSAPTWTKRGITVRRGLLGKFEIDMEIPEFHLDREYLKTLYQVVEEPKVD